MGFLGLVPVHTDPLIISLNTDPDPQQPARVPQHPAPALPVARKVPSFSLGGPICLCL